MNTLSDLINDLEKMPLKEIAHRISEGDRLAVNEFHRRTPFLVAGGARVTFREYVHFLVEMALDSWQWGRLGSNAVERAGDLLLDRFFNMPDAVTDEAKHHRNHEGGDSGTDCRNYFRAFLTSLEDDIQKHGIQGDVQAEEFAANHLQTFVKRHFHFCLRESLRESNQFISRYTWKVNGSRFCLWFPKSFGGKKRGEWLKTHIGTPDSTNPLERERIQALIDRELVMPQWVSFSNVEDRTGSSPSPSTSRGCADSEDKTFPTIREFIADEKAESIALQRRAIRALGPERLRRLVRAILEHFNGDEESDTRIAHEHGLSPATYSRFAGRDWDKGNGNGNGNGSGAAKSVSVPDLFLNIAHVIATKHPEFAAVARQAGVWKRVAEVASFPIQPRMRMIANGQ